MQWKVFLAAATGKQHLDRGEPCQDSGHVCRAGPLLAAAVCDGAGSAAQGGDGARFLARRVAELLLAQAGTTVQERIREAIGQARAELGTHAAARQHELRDYACTLVGCLLDEAGGTFFHIGDGFAVHRGAGGPAQVSLPANGEYSDETYFATAEDWADHLRFTELAAVGPGSVIGLLTDGTAPFAIDRQRTDLFGPFIDPIVRYLRDSDEAAGARALHAVLADDKTHAITADDKTLLLALALAD